MTMYSVQTSASGKTWVTVGVRYTLEAAQSYARERHSLYQNAVGRRPQFRVCEIPNIDDLAVVIETLEHAHA